MAIILWFKTIKRRIYVKYALYDFAYQLLKDMENPETASKVTNAFTEAVVKQFLKEDKDNTEE